MKTHNKYLFVENDIHSVMSDVSDGYIKGFDQDEEKRIKLPHKNFTLLGRADECINAPYAEEFSEEIVDEAKLGHFFDYELGVYHYSSASDSFQTLARKLDLKPPDYILRDDTNRI